jgi:predicted ABC-type ATPase
VKSRSSEKRATADTGSNFATSDSHPPNSAANGIAERVAKGGHDVPHEDVSRRFERSLKNLADGIPLADESFVYDNSTRAGITLMAIFATGQLTALAPAIPRWMEYALGPLLNR